MSNFTEAAKAAGLPICPHCEEMTRIERQNSRVWWCGNCAKTFIVEPKL